MGSWRQAGFKTGGTNPQAGKNTFEEDSTMATTANPTRDDFAALLNQSLGGENESFEGRVVTGTITEIEYQHTVID
jgi:hypothetical protein